VTDTDARLLDLLDQHCTDTEPDYELNREAFAQKGHRIQSPIEPCERCGKRVYLLLPGGWTKPVWVQLGQLKDADTLFPVMSQKRHTCGNGGSWSVEAALFVESALKEWGLVTLS
jgi:hypothetical protein